MSKVINVSEARAHWSSLLDRAHAGEEIVLGKAGKPYARLVPLRPVRKRTLGFIKGKFDLTCFDPLPEEELRAWEGK